MKKEVKKVPQLRFPEFTGDWEQRKLGELGSVQTCKRIFKEQTSEQGDIPFYKNGTIGLEPDSYISREVYEEFRRLYPYPEVGDTLISVVGSIGRTAEYTGKDEYFQDSNVVWLKTDGSINKKFLKVSYQVIKWLIEGSTVKHLYNDNILKSEIVMPPSQLEQEKIAIYFESIDHLITLHQRKLEKIKKFKKGVMQKLFSQEIRFKADDGSEFPEWKEKTFHEVIKLYRGSSPRPIVEYIVDDNQGLNWIKISDVPQNGNVITTVKEHISKEGAEKSRAVYKGEIILSNSMSFGKPCILGIDGFIHDGWFVIREYEKYLNKWYLCQLLNSDIMYKQYRRLAAGGVVLNISSEIVNSTKIPVPCLSEQQKIADCLSSLDEVIEKQKATLAAWKELKKGLLQQMFV